MELKDVQNVDFSTLNIEKYLNWLHAKYELFSRVNELPYIDYLYNHYEARKYFANSHYLAKRVVNLPPHIAKAYDDKIEYFKTQYDELKDVVYDLVLFESVSCVKGAKSTKYGVFSENELKNIRIDVAFFNLYFKSFNTIWKSSFIDEIEKDFETSPLSKEAYYLQKADNIKNIGFDYLEQILNGQVIYNLDNSTKSREFFTEVSRIWEISYLEKQALQFKISTRKPSICTLNPKKGNLKWEIRVIHDNTNTLFVSTLSQWENLFSENIQPFKNPIELQTGISKADLRFFVDSLKFHGFIRSGAFLKILGESNAFSKNGKRLTAHDYKTANNGKNYPNTRNADKVTDVFRALGLLD